MSTNAASEDGLDSCPFCGAEAAIYYHGGDGASTASDQVDVGCAGGCTITPRVVASTNVEAEENLQWAISEWNTRSRVSAGGVVATVDDADDLHLAICQAVHLMNQGDLHAGHDLLRQTLVDFADKKAPLSRTEIVQQQQRSGTGEVSAIMVSPERRVCVLCGHAGKLNSNGVCVRLNAVKVEICGCVCEFAATASPAAPKEEAPDLIAFKWAETLQRRLYDECVTANWDPERCNTFAEEIAHLHEELSEAFRAFRRYKDFEVREVNGKLEGVPIELADALIGMFYNAELYGFDLLEAVERKHQFNLGRNYVAEGRQLHAPATTPSPDAAKHYFCSCGGALTAEEYIEHYFEKGHDHGEPQLLARAAAREICALYGHFGIGAETRTIAGIIRSHCFPTGGESVSAERNTKHE